MPEIETKYPSACGGNFDEPRDHPFADYKGRRIYFCTKACKRVFDQDPEKFMSGKVEHPIEEDA
jgi:YHS domain-containing protein